MERTKINKKLTHWYINVESDQHVHIVRILAVEDNNKIPIIAESPKLRYAEIIVEYVNRHDELVACLRNVIIRGFVKRSDSYYDEIKELLDREDEDDTV